MRTPTPTVDRVKVFQELSEALAAAYRARLAAAAGEAAAAWAAGEAGAGQRAARAWRALEAARVPFTAPGAPTP